MAQRFYNLVLLPRVRDDIAEYKRLNFHLYMALKKALFKPGAWFKGGSPGGSSEREGLELLQVRAASLACAMAVLGVRGGVLPAVPPFSHPGLKVTSPLTLPRDPDPTV